MTMLFWNRDSRRRQFFIRKEFQGKFILLYALCAIGPAGLAVTALYAQARMALEKYLFSSHLKITHTGEIFSGLLIRTNLISSALVIVLVMLLSLYIFRRLNTHFFRMEARFDAMGRGDFSPLPQLPSRFKEVSTLIHHSEQTRQKYRERFREIELLLNKLEKSLTAGAATAELRQLSKELAGHLQLVSLPERSSPENG
jgi:hypothetical protein